MLFGPTVEPPFVVHGEMEVTVDQEKDEYSAPRRDICSPVVPAQPQSVGVEPEASDRGLKDSADVLPAGSPPQDVSSLFGLEKPDDRVNKG